ncbi:hypothetical protein RPALISO_181 [Ruegeria phage RpAliso]|nr:hypothetical protein RPALISO_181 [Ruegeria phage RpAliso]
MLTPYDPTLKDLSLIEASFDEVKGTVTLEGIPYREFRALMTAAALHLHTSKPDVVQLDPDSDMLEVQKANAEENLRWHMGQKDLIDYIEGEVLAAAVGYKATHKEELRLKREHRCFSRRHGHEHLRAWSVKSKADTLPELAPADAGRGLFAAFHPARTKAMSDTPRRLPADPLSSFQKKLDLGMGLIVGVLIGSFFLMVMGG